MVHLRPATVHDCGTIVEFVRALARYERASEQAVLTAKDLERDGFGENPVFRVIIAEWNGMPAGFALFLPNYSTWQGRKGIYLEDLFVLPEFRGKGIGKALLRHVARIAVEEGCGRFQWQVLDWNTPAIDVYEALGAKKLEEWITMRLEGEDLFKLAGVTAEVF